LREGVCHIATCTGFVEATRHTKLHLKSLNIASVLPQALHNYATSFKDDMNCSKYSKTLI
jgi:hypothetical protein